MAITTDNTFDRYKNKKTSELYTQIIEVFNYQENYLNGLSQQHLWDLCSLAVNTAPAIATGKYFYSLVNEITIRVKDFQELQETGSCQEGETCYNEEQHALTSVSSVDISRNCCGSGRYCNPPCGHERCTDEKCVYEIPGQCEELIEEEACEGPAYFQNRKMQDLVQDLAEEDIKALFFSAGWNISLTQGKGKLYAAKWISSNSIILVMRDSKYDGLWAFREMQTSCNETAVQGWLLTSQLPEFINTISKPKNQ